MVQPLRFLMLVFVLSLPMLSQAQSSWPRFRGPNGSGIASDARNLPVNLTKEAQWQTPVGPGHSSPVIWGDRLFLTSHRENQLETLCLDRINGTVLWRRSVTAKALERVHPVNSVASPTPATDGQRVYVSFGSFGLLCYDLEGKELWRRPLQNQGRNTFGSGSSPMLVDEKVILVCENQDASFIEALDKKTGKLIWHKDRSQYKSSWSTPTVRNHNGTSELLVYSVYWLTALDLKDGADRWSVPGLADEPTVTPILGNGLVYVSSYNMKTNTEVIGLPSFAQLLKDYDEDKDGLISFEEGKANTSVLSRYDADGEGDHPLRIFYRMLDEDKNQLISKAEYKKLQDWVAGFSQENGLVAIRPAQGAGDKAQIVWRHRVGVPEIPSPLFFQGRIYMVKNGGIMTCLDGANGNKVYQTRIGAGGPYYASPIVGDGKIYAASARGVVTVIQVGDPFKVLGQTDLGERIMATPAIVKDRLYIRTQSKVLAFGS